MKKQHLLLAWRIGNLPMLLLALFVLVSPVKSWADPVAIGTGTVTLNYANCTYHDVDSWVEESGYTGGIITTWTPSNGNGCLYILGGDGNQKAYWDVTIQSGNYDVEMHYGTTMYGITSKFNIIDPANSAEIQLLYNQGYQGAPVDLTRSDNFTLTTNSTKTYRVQAINMYPGGGSHFVVEYIKFTRTDGCVSPVDAVFNGGDATSGSVDNIEACAGTEFSMPDKGTLSYPGYIFTGWKLNNAGALITAGTSYTMPAGGASFTAQWEAVVVPTVTNLAINNAVNNTIPLSWNIPGICDLSNPIGANKSADASNLTSATYNDVDDYVTAAGTSPLWEQYGVAFNIPTTTNVEWLSFEYKGYHADIGIWGGLCDASYAYWSGNAPGLSDNTDWISSGEQAPIYSYWHENMGGAITAKSISQVAIYANAGNGTYSDVSFSVRNIRYHIANQEDIDHVVVMRKEGSASANLSDGTQIYSGTKSHFTDEDTKTPGTTYYYTVFALDEEDNVSAAVSVSHTMEVVATCTVSYENGGASGTVPTDANEYAEGNTVTMPNAGSLYKSFSNFTGWKKNNAGELIAAGAAYTVTAADVTAETISFTAQWEEDNITIRIPSVTTLNSANQSTSVPYTDDWDVTDDGMNDRCLDMKQKTAEWNVYITPGEYDISTICAVPYWGIGYRLEIIDPLNNSQVMELFAEHTSGAEGTPIIRNLANTFDLSDLIEGKRYIIRIADTWPNCSLLVYDINFAQQLPPTKQTYERTGLTIGNYGTICWQYAVAAEDIEGAEIYEFVGWPAGENEVVLNQVTAMNAGQPYIYRATANSMTLSYVEQNNADAGSHKGLIGSYSKVAITPNDDNYIIYSNKLYLVDSEEIYVGANKAYINRSEAESAYTSANPAPGMRQIRIPVNGNQVPTGIDPTVDGQSSIRKFLKDGQLIIVRDGKIYNAQGSLIAK